MTQICIAGLVSYIPLVYLLSIEQKLAKQKSSLHCRKSCYYISAMGVAEGASGASADAPGVGLEIVSVSVCQ